MKHMKKENLVYYIIVLLIIMVAIHYYICELFISGTNVDNLIRDIFIIIALIICVKQVGIKAISKNKVLVFNMATLIFFALISLVVNREIGVLNILRTYMIPISICIVTSVYKFTREQFEKIQEVMIITISIVAFYGFFQAFFLGDDFIIKLGYPSQGGYLVSSSYYIGGFFGYQRNVGTFASPNICGIIIVFALIAVLTDNGKCIKQYRRTCIISMILGLLGTLSRSAMLGFAVAMCIYGAFIYKKGSLKCYLKKLKSIMPFVASGIIVAFVLDWLLLEGVFYRMLKSSFIGTVMGTDLSMIGHINDLLKPISGIILHPFGFGFGNNGPMALEYLDNANMIESSIYLMMYEIGIVFAILFFVPYIKVAVDTIKNRKRYKYYTPALISIAVMITYVLLPNVQAYEVLFYSFMYIGFYYNKSVKDIYCSKKKKAAKKMLYVMNVEWNWIKQRPHFIAEQIANSYDMIILYQYKYGRKGLQKRDTNDLNVKPIYLIPKISGNERLRFINDKLLAYKIRNIIRYEKPEYLFLTYPTQVDIVPKNYEGKVIYDCMDNHMAFFKDVNEAEKIMNMENKLMEKASHILVSADNLKQKLLNRSNVEESKICLIRNAYDGKILPVEKQKNKNYKEKCRLAYVGTISEWFDWNMLIESINRDSKIEYHLYGPIHMTDIPVNPSIIYHGTIEHAQIYDAIKDMDGLIMPFIVNEIIESVDPVKLYEYINFNKPIIACYYKEVERFLPYADLYRNVDEYCSFIEMVYEKNSCKYNLDERNQFLLENTWKSRCKQVIEFISK